MRAVESPRTRIQESSDQTGPFRASATPQVPGERLIASGPSVTHGPFRSTRMDPVRTVGGPPPATARTAATSENEPGYPSRTARRARRTARDAIGRGRVLNRGAGKRTIESMISTGTAWAATSCGCSSSSSDAARRTSAAWKAGLNRCFEVRNDLPAQRVAAQRRVTIGWIVAPGQPQQGSQFPGLGPGDVQQGAHDASPFAAECPTGRLPRPRAGCCRGWFPLGRPSCVR